MAKPMSRADRLAAMQDKLKKVELSSGGAGFWSPKEGKSIVRIMPEVAVVGGKEYRVGDMQFFYQQVGKHNFPPKGAKHCYCPKFTSEGELECPVCETVSDLWKGDAGSKALAKELGVRKSYWMNIIPRDDEAGGVKIFTPGVKIFTAIITLINDPDYGDITDITEGFDLTIERHGSGLETEYNVNPRRNPSALNADEDKIIEWMSKAKDLSAVEVSEDPEQDKELSAGHSVFVLPYNRLSREMDLDGDLGAEDVADDDDDEDEPVPAKKTVAAPAKATITKRAPVEPDDDDEDDEDDDTVVEKKVPAAKQEVVQRQARRSFRR
jgi:hypothetical protein